MKKVLVLMGYKTVNYGSILQSVATQRTLEKIGLKVDVINVENLWRLFKKKKIAFYISQLQFPFLIQSKGGMYASKLVRLFNRDYRNAYNTRKRLFNDYITKNLELTPLLRNYEDVKKLTPNYDYVLIGSDQVWLPSSVITDIYTLSFAWDNSDVKTISYAPSFGIDYIMPKYREMYKEMLTKIDYLSVREDSGISICKNIANREAVMVADPVLMMDEKEWLSIIPYKVNGEKGYVFVYLMGKSRKQRKRIIEYAKKSGLQTIALVHLDEYVWADEKIYDKAYASLSPEDFLNYIRNAEVVFTDSYHCFLLSLLHKKKVGVFLRFKQDSKVSTNNRIYSVFNRLHIQNGLIDEEKVISDEELVQDYVEIERHIDEFRSSSYQFLSSSFEI